MSRPLRILFAPNSLTQFYPGILDFRPLGGTETGIIRLAEALSRMGHDISIYQDNEYPPPPIGPKYLSKADLSNAGHFDAVIVVRGLLGLFNFWHGTKKFFWTTDAPSSQSSYGLGDKRFYNMVDGVFLLSQWHVDTMCETSNLPLEKTHILPNGVVPEYFYGEEERHPKRLIYSSSPHRGLIHMRPIFIELKKRHPDLELHVFSSTNRYRYGYAHTTAPEDFPFLEPLRNLPDCYLHGSVLQKQIAREFMKSSILIYPCNFEETSCITIMEAMAGGAAIVTSDYGALKETVGDAGIVIKETAGSAKFFERFIEETDKLLSNPQLIHGFGSKGKERAKLFNWDLTAQNLVDYFQKTHYLGR
jgi:glycosyltransferase involved in cell wall biosynthesis